MIRYAGDATGITGGTPVAGTGSLDGFTIQEFKTPGSSTFAVDLNARLAATLEQPISGTGDFTYAGPGRLTLAGTVAVQSGGRVSPANSIGVLTQGATSFDAGAIFKYEVVSSDLDALGTAADLLVVNGALNIAAGTLLEFSDLAGLSTQPFVEDTTVFAMINYTGTWNEGLFTYNGQTLTNGSRFFVGSQMWEIDYAYVYDTVTPGSTVRPFNFQGSHLPASGTQTFVTITAVPEPATLALGAAAAGRMMGRGCLLLVLATLARVGKFPADSLFGIQECGVAGHACRS